MGVCRPIDRLQGERIPVGVLSVPDGDMDGGTLDVVDRMLGRGSYSVRVWLWEYRYAAGGRVKPEYPCVESLERAGPVLVVGIAACGHRPSPVYIVL